MRFLLWQERMGLAPGEEEKKKEARGLTRFTGYIARHLSGEALVTNVRSLLKTLRNSISQEKEERIRAMLPLLRREANRKNPPGQQAAEAISLDMLRELMERARQAKLTKMERQALDIFLVAFESMSRVGEIAALQVEEVAADGRTILVRPKTGAKTWLKLMKRVSDTRGFNAAERLVHYRRQAIRRGKKSLFRGRNNKVLETATITSYLRRLSRKLGCGARITSHSARKGAAVEALKAGVPLPVIQALGAWKDQNSMQAYIGEAVRRSTSLMEVIDVERRSINKDEFRGKKELMGRWKK